MEELIKDDVLVISVTIIPISGGFRYSTNLICFPVSHVYFFVRRVVVTVLAGG